MFSCAVFVACVLCAGQAPAQRQHPFLFTTVESLDRAQRGMETNPEFKRIAEDLLGRAREASMDGLPSLASDWWETEGRNFPWRDTYPEINHFTGEVPRKWTAFIQTCTVAGVLFGDEELVAKGKEALLGLSVYRFEYEHYDTGMNYATWGMVALDCYDILYDRFSSGERERMDAFFGRMLDAVEHNDAYWVEHEPGGALNNHYLWHKLGRVMHALFYGDEETARDVVFGPKGVEECMRHGFTDDGLWLEASLNYQFAATTPFAYMAEILENAGASFSLWDYTTDDGRTLRQSYDALFDTLFPDTTLPNVGDCYAHRVRLGAHGDYEFLYARFREPRYAWALNNAGRRGPHALLHGVPDLPEAAGPPLASRLWPEHGYVMLRSVEGCEYWRGDGWTLFGTFSNAPVHEHADKLSIMLFGGGRHWLVDAEARAGVYHAFSAAVQRELNRETLAHNTVLVDRASQRSPSRPLSLEQYHTLPSAKRVTMGDRDALLYEGVRQLRTLLVRDEYVLDVFQVASDRPRLFEWVCHVDGKRAWSSRHDWEPATLPKEGPMKWIQEPLEAHGGRSYAEVFTEGGLEFRLDLLVSADARVTACGFPRTDGPDPEVYATRMVGVEGRNAWFVALYRMGGRDSHAALELTPGEHHTWSVSVEVEGATRFHAVPRLTALD